MIAQRPDDAEVLVPLRVGQHLTSRGDLLVGGDGEPGEVVRVLPPVLARPGFDVRVGIPGVDLDLEAEPLHELVLLLLVHLGRVDGLGRGVGHVDVRAGAGGRVGVVAGGTLDHSAADHGKGQGDRAHCCRRPEGEAAR